MKPRNLATGFLLCTCLLTGMLAQPAHAQRNGHLIGAGSGNMGGNGTNLLTPRLIERYAITLHFDAAQTEAALTLLAPFEAASEAIDKQANDEIDSYQEEGDAQSLRLVGQHMGEIHRKAGERRDAEAARFMADLRSLLTGEPGTLWPVLERQRRREAQIGPRFGLIGGVSGSSVDLIALVEDLKLSGDEVRKIQDHLDAYSIEADRIARGEQDCFIESSRSIVQARVSGQFDEAGYTAMKAKARERGLALRDMNRKYVRLMAAALGDESRAKLEETYQLKAMPPIFKPSSTQRGLNAAFKFKDLTDDQREKISNLRQQYFERLPALNARWADEIISAETTGQSVMVEPELYSTESPAVALAHDARRTLDTDFAVRLAAALSPEQRERLPKPRVAQKRPGEVRLRETEDNMGD